MKTGWDFVNFCDEKLATIARVEKQQIKKRHTANFSKEFFLISEREF
jgi:hypothetical protein